MAADALSLVDGQTGPGESLDVAALSAWVAAHVENFRAPLMLTKFAGGQSNPTYRIDTPGGAYVLRRKPFGPLLSSAHAIDREYRLIAALHPTGFPVPRPFGLCMSDDVIGAPFYVMELVEGRNIWDGGLPDMAPADRTATYHAMIDTLAALHSVDHVAAGLGDYGRPGNYFERQVSRWTRQYRAAQTDDLPEMERLIAWLPASLPVQARTSIVHGDFRIDNMIFAPGEPAVRAVLDWELSTIGDPMADLAYFLLNWLPRREGRSVVSGLDLDALGIPRMPAMVARYCAQTGRDDIPDLSWYFSFNLFRLASIVQGIKRRVQDGTASNADAAAVAARVPHLAHAAWTCAVQAGA